MLHFSATQRAPWTGPAHGLLRPRRSASHARSPHCCRKVSASAMHNSSKAPITLADFRGRVVAVTFIFTMCTATCPVLTPMMSFVQDQLGARLRRENRVRFHHGRSGTRYARRAEGICAGVRRQFRGLELPHRHSGGYPGCDAPVWRLCVEVREWGRGPHVPHAAIQDVTRRYGVYALKSENGDVDHTFLTSVVDRHGILRVQYLGVRFDPEELRHDLLILLKE